MFLFKSSGSTAGYIYGTIYIWQYNLPCGISQTDSPNTDAIFVVYAQRGRKWTGYVVCLKSYIDVACLTQYTQLRTITVGLAIPHDLHENGTSDHWEITFTP